MLGEGKGKTEGCLQTHIDVAVAHLSARRERQRTVLLLFLGMLAFKLACDAGFLWLTTQDSVSYPLRFSLGKYLFGSLCCFALFFLMPHDGKRASSFFLYFVFLFQIVPITASYAFADRATEYYFVLIVAYAFCILLTGYVGNKKQLQRSRIFTKTIAFGYAGIMLLIMLLIVRRYGMPSLAALNLSNVYVLRGSGAFSLGKYENYLFTWTTAVILPAGIAFALTKKRYIIACGLCGIMLLLYLYSAHKTFLFSIPLVFACTLWSKRKNFYKELFTILCFGYLLLVFLIWFSPMLQDLIQRVFSLLARRVMYVPANNKFHYFDYFTNNPKMGIGGIIPRWLFYVPNYYENIPYSYEISAIYYNLPEMNSNTGFLAEGYMRFGHLGTVGILVFFGCILKLIDRFQERAGYSLAVGVFIYQIYSLADAHLLDSLVLGPWMLLMFILLFCGSTFRGEGHRSGMQMKRFRLLKRSERQLLW